MYDKLCSRGERVTNIVGWVEVTTQRRIVVLSNELSAQFESCVQKTGFVNCIKPSLRETVTLYVKLN